MGMLRRIFWDQIGDGLCPNRYCIIDEGEIFGTCKGGFDTVSGLFCRLDGIVDGNTLGDAKGRWVNGRGWTLQMFCEMLCKMLRRGGFG